MARRLVQQVTLRSAPLGAVRSDVGAPADHVLFANQGSVESSATGRVHARNVLEAEFLLSPPLGQFGLMEFTVLTEIVEADCSHDVPQIAPWEQAGRFADVPHGRTP